MLRVENMGLDIAYKRRMYLNYLPSYDYFTIYVIIHGGHIGFIAARRVVVS